VPIRSARNGFGGADTGVRVPGVYARMLREACRDEVRRRGDYPYLALMDDAERVAAAKLEIEVQSDELFNARVSVGEPVVAWWYWFKDLGLLPLPEPLDEVGNAAGPRRLLVTVDDRIEEIQR
jgi:hypothetical protein